MKMYFIFGYLKSYTSDSGGSTKFDIIDMLELEKSEPSVMIQIVLDELKRLIAQNKLSKYLTGGTSEDFYSTFDEFFGEFLIPKKNGGPDDKKIIDKLNALFMKDIEKIFIKRQ